MNLRVTNDTEDLSKFAEFRTFVEEEIRLSNEILDAETKKNKEPFELYKAYNERTRKILECQQIDKEIFSELNKLQKESRQIGSQREYQILKQAKKELSLKIVKQIKNKEALKQFNEDLKLKGKETSNQMLEIVLQETKRIFFRDAAKYNAGLLKYEKNKKRIALLEDQLIQSSGSSFEELQKILSLKIAKQIKNKEALDQAEATLRLRGDEQNCRISFDKIRQGSEQMARDVDKFLEDQTIQIEFQKLEKEIDSLFQSDERSQRVFGNFWDAEEEPFEMIKKESRDSEKLTNLNPENTKALNEDEKESQLRSLKLQSDLGNQIVWWKAQKNKEELPIRSLLQSNLESPTALQKEFEELQKKEFFKKLNKQVANEVVLKKTKEEIERIFNQLKSDSCNQALYQEFEAKIAQQIKNNQAYNEADKEIKSELNRRLTEAKIKGESEIRSNQNQSNQIVLESLTERLNKQTKEIMAFEQNTKAILKELERFLIQKSQVNSMKSQRAEKRLFEDINSQQTKKLALEEAQEVLELQLKFIINQMQFNIEESEFIDRYLERQIKNKDAFKQADKKIKMKFVELKRQLCEETEKKLAPIYQEIESQNQFQKEKYVGELQRIKQESLEEEKFSSKQLKSRIKRKLEKLDVQKLLNRRKK